VLPKGQHIPVLMMTGLEDAASIQHAYQVGATDFITKPINFGLLEFRLEYMLRAKVTSDELRQSEALLYSAQRLANLGHFVMGSDRRFSVWNSQTQAVLGLEQEPNITTLPELLQYIRAEDREPVAQALANPVENLSIPPLEYRIKFANGPTRTIVQHSRVQTDEFGVRVIGTVQDISERRQVEFSLEETLQISAAPCDPHLKHKWLQAIEHLGVPLLELPSGAGHDAMKMHDLMPQAMLFVRGLNSGISHNPLESTSSSDMQLAYMAMMHVLHHLQNPV
jgi:PAS domain-containing protein